MRQILATTKRGLETVSVEALDALDGQGAQSYASPVDVQAAVVKGGTYEVDQGGSKVQCPVTLYVPGDESYLPVVQDRVTLSTDEVLTVMARDEFRGLSATRDQLDHVRLRCRLGE